MSKTRYTYIKHEGTWKQPKNVFVKQSGAWTQCKGIYTKRSGEWVLVWPSQRAIITTSTDLVSLTTSLNQPSTKQKITITNSGDADLRITSITAGTPTKFSINIDASGLGGTPSVGSPAIIAPGKNKYFEVSITAGLSDGVDSEVVTITAYDNVVNSVVTKAVSVSGTVEVTNAAIIVDRSSLSFNTSLTKTSSAIKVTVTNSGQDTLRITSLGATTPAKFSINLNITSFGTPSVGSPVTIAPNTSKSFDVTITAGSTTGTDTGTITLGYLTNLLGASDSSAIEVSGSITALAAVLSVTPTSLSFGSVNTDQQTTVKTITLKNSGNDTLTVNSITAGNASKFSVNIDQKSVAAGGIGPTLPATIDAGQSKTIDIRLTAGGIAGADNGTVTVGYTTDVIGTTASTVVSASATVTQLVAGFLEITPSPLSGTVLNNETGKLIGTIKILNKGQTSITGLSFTTTNPTQWTFGGFDAPSGQPALSTPLGAGVAYELDIYVNGSAVGSGSGSINFTATSNGQPITGQVIVNVTVGGSVIQEPTLSFEFSAQGPVRFSPATATTATLNVQNTGECDIKIKNVVGPAWVTGVTSGDWGRTMKPNDKISYTLTKNSSTQTVPSGQDKISVIASRLDVSGAADYEKFQTLEIDSAGGTPTPGVSGTIDLTSGTEWTVPAGVTQVQAILVGGGAGGATGSEGNPWVSGGGGGGCGEVVTVVSTVTPGAKVAYAIGAAGVGGTGAAGGAVKNGTAGGKTTFNGFSAQGGEPPTTNTTYGNAHRPLGGLFSGYNGAVVKSSTDSGSVRTAGGAGGTGTYGTGGAGAPAGAVGQGAIAGSNGTGYGAGGGGGNGRSGDAPSQGNGGNGTKGFIRLTWPPP